MNSAFLRPVGLVVMLLGSIASIGLGGGAVNAQEVPSLQINSEQYIVIDAETGEVFAQRGIHERVAMASLTKVFTAIQAIEEAPPDFAITTEEADLREERASVMGFGPGETFTLEELLHGLMLPSGNDAAYAIARALGEEDGDTPQEAVDRFVARMNQRLKDMGLNDTNLIRPDGWGVPNHYTTAHDLSAFMRHALQYPRFVDLISTATYETSSGYYLVNNNRLMNSYEDLLGGKTGYDDDAGWCLIEVAERGGNRMISVTFDGEAPDDWYDDNRVLLEYGLEEKAERIAADRDITGEIVAFLDPDAAVISRTASSGGSLAETLSAPAPAANIPANQASVGSAASDDGLDAGAAGSMTFGASSTAGETALAVSAVVGLVCLARAFGAYSQPGALEGRTVARKPRRAKRRSPGPRPSQSTPSISS